MFPLLIGGGLLLNIRQVGVAAGLVGLLFLLVGGFFGLAALAAALAPRAVKFDGVQRLVISGSAQAGTSFETIRALQLLRKGWEDPDGVLCYELNLVLEGGSRVTLVCEGGPIEAAPMADFLGVPLWEGDSKTTPPPAPL
jgi:hypothetical protein